jgi:hypothetical protein
MHFELKHILMMAALLITSIAVVTFVPATEVEEKHIVPLKSGYQHDGSVVRNSETRVNEGHIGVIVAILAKGMIAIVLGTFATFCVCSRFGACLVRRNNALLASTYESRGSTDV